MTRAMFVVAGVGLLGRSGVGDRGVVLWLVSSSSVDNSWTTGVKVEVPIPEVAWFQSPAGSLLATGFECRVQYWPSVRSSFYRLHLTVNQWELT